MTLAYKALNNTAPKYIPTLLTSHFPTRVIRSRDQLLMEILKHRNSYSARFFNILHQHFGMIYCMAYERLHLSTCSISHQTLINCSERHIDTGVKKEQAISIELIYSINIRMQIIIL